MALSRPFNILPKIGPSDAMEDLPTSKNIKMYIVFMLVLFLYCCFLFCVITGL